MATNTALIVQHVPHEGPGLIADYLTAHGMAYEVLPVFEGASFPEVARYGFLVVLGGPMSANDTDLYPWLAPEKALIAAAISRRVPTLGVCLGAQLIAAVLGAKVYPAPGREIGFGPVTPRLRADSPFGAVVDSWGRDGHGSPIVLHWHGETFDLPQGGVLLARTDLCENQMFSYGRRVLGLQFHLEVKNSDLPGFVAGNAADFKQARGRLDRVAEPEAVASASEDESRRAALLWAFLDLLLDVSTTPSS